MQSHFGGRSHLERALGTSDVVAARRARNRLLPEWEAAFAEARTLPTPDAYRPVLERYGLTGPATPDSIRRLREALSLESQIAADADTAYEERLERERASARAWVDGLSDGEVEALRTRALYAHRLPALLPGQPKRPIAALASGAVVAPDEVITDLDRVEGRVVPASPSASVGVTITDAHALYLAETPDLSPRTRREWETAVKEFTELHGDMQVKDITKAAMIAYKDSLRSHVTAKGTPRSPATVNKLLSAIRSILEVSINHGHLAEPNPAAKLTIRIKDKGGVGRKRMPLLISEIEAVQVSREDRDYWLWWLLVYTGARLGEIAQMRKADVAVRGGVPCILIHDDGGRRVKNGGSVRAVPLHRDIRADFIAWVQSRPDGPLWPRYWREVDGVMAPHTDPASKRWNRTLLLAGAHGDRKCVHSIRHAFKDWLRVNTRDEEMRDAIMGHSGGGIGRDYGSGHFVQKLQREIDKIDLGQIKRLQEADLSEWQREVDDHGAD
ncbi:tyrosine-type recombinase/integrase [Azospirillum sp. RWY-5-1]|uniref:Tyrosine-type recombinase/integrase n=1 Tax=Azospirillum oleiclasticum TaxID=2735135 RepID=A0ABX2TBP2_9PROT|nr:tyrosine-type recombinase/integrase [Azospirillum oleiclasticum]NYZ20449.1 tyrosine-type recombinase/integrase [Azospirillum oleiclasticum]